MNDANGSADDAGNPAGGNAAPWYGADAGDDVKGFVELKGWTDPKAAITSYRNLETLLGADKAGRAVVWPKDDADADGWKALNAKLGVPETADAYKLPVPDGDDGAFAKALAPLLLKAGLSTRQAEALATEWNGYQAAQLADINAKIETGVRADMDALKQEWGPAYPARCELAKRAAASLGLNEDDVADWVASSGYAKVQKTLAAMGERIGEDKFVGDGRPGGQVMTPASASARLEQLKADPDWLNKFANGDATARAEKDRLDRFIAGEAA